MGMLFNGTTQYLEGGDLYGSQSALTISLWVKPTAVSTSFRQFCGQFNASTGWGVESTGSADTGDDVLFYVSNTQGGRTTVNCYVAGTWVHVVCVFNGAGTGNSGRMQIYTDGVNRTLTFIGTIPTTIGDVAHNFRLGATSNGVRYFDGVMADVAFWNEALSADEAAALYRGVNPRRIRPLLLSHFWPLRRGMESIDLVAGGATLTQVNSPTADAHPLVALPRLVWPAGPDEEDAAGGQPMIRRLMTMSRIHGTEGVLVA